mmetsp:Transcript_45615/g.134924  ORF Transcript_45615/g.134924 Transcript_45615/m.134924 type:complete len:332 (-) Transcript_45615:625-1620(-)
MPKHASSPRLHSERSAAARRPHLGPSSASHDRRSNGKPSHDPIVNHGLGRSRARRDAALTEALIGLLEYTRQPRPLDPVRARLAAPAALRVRARRPAPARRPEGILRLLAQLLKRVDQPALRRRGARAPGGRLGGRGREGGRREGGPPRRGRPRRPRGDKAAGAVGGGEAGADGGDGTPARRRAAEPGGGLALARRVQLGLRGAVDALQGGRRLSVGLARRLRDGREGTARLLLLGHVGPHQGPRQGGQGGAVRDGQGLRGRRGRPCDAHRRREALLKGGGGGGRAEGAVPREAPERLLGRLWRLHVVSHDRAQGRQLCGRLCARGQPVSG